MRLSLFFALSGLLFGGLSVLTLTFLRGFDAPQTGAVIGLCVVFSVVQWLMAQWQLRRCLGIKARGCQGWWLWAEVREVQRVLTALEVQRQDNLLKFLSNLSHELNTNLNAITGAAQAFFQFKSKERCFLPCRAKIDSDIYCHSNKLGTFGGSRDYGRQTPAVPYG